MASDDLNQVLAQVPQIAGLNLSIEGDRTRNDPVSAQLVVAYKGVQCRFAIHHRGDLNTTAVAVLASRLISPEERSKYLIYTPFVNTTCGERLRQHGINFVDDHGHVFLQTPNLYLFVIGRVQKAPKPRSFAGVPDARPFKTATLKMIYAFLADPNLDESPDEALINQTYRDIGNGTGISLGSVSNAMEILMATGHVIEQTPGRRILVNRRRLFERWVQDYGTRLRPKLVMAHFRAPNPRWWQEVDLRGWDGLWGGEVAASKLTQFLVPETSTLYADHVPDSFILDHDLRRDPAGGLEVLRPFWRSGRSSFPSGCAHPFVVYADLAATDIDRNLQAGQRIYDQYIREVVEST